MLKRDILIGNGTFNKNHAKVTESRFINDEFYDPQDLAQVKYEMLRTARESERSVGDITDSFGFSRAGFYKIKKSFEKEGVSAFASNKTGPHNAWKLTKEIQQFIDDYLSDHPDASSEVIVTVLETERGVKISKRSVERCRSRGLQCGRKSQ